MTDEEGVTPTVGVIASWPLAEAGTPASNNAPNIAGIAGIKRRTDLRFMWLSSGCSFERAAKQLEAISFRKLAVHTALPLARNGVFQISAFRITGDHRHAELAIVPSPITPHSEVCYASGPAVRSFVCFLKSRSQPQLWRRFSDLWHPSFRVRNQLANGVPGYFCGAA